MYVCFCKCYVILHTYFECLVGVHIRSRYEPFGRRYFLVFFLRSLAPLMASLLMPTRKACGRYVCHDVCLSAPTVRTLNSTIGLDHDLSVIFEMSFINAPCVTTRSSQAMCYKSRILSRTRSSSRILETSANHHR